MLCYQHWWYIEHTEKNYFSLDKLVDISLGNGVNKLIECENFEYKYRKVGSATNIKTVFCIIYKCD